MEEKEIKDILFKVNAEFREAFDRHQKLDKQLVQFQSRAYMTDEDKWKEKKIKKSKLQMKDKMYQMIKEYGKSLK